MPLSSGIPLQQDDQMELTKENFVDIFTAARLYSDDMLEKLFQKLVDDIDQIDKFIFEEGDDTENCVRHLTYLQLLQLLFDRGYEFKRKMIENIFFMLTRIMEFSARLKGIQFVVHCIMEEEQLQCKQEWFQFFLCQCIDNHLDTFFYHAENFSNCTMRRLLIYRLAVFISSLPRDALMKPVKNVLLSAKLSALNYPESLQTIISRMLMLLRKQTATSFIFGLAAYFCLRKLLPDVAIYEKSEAQNGLMKEVPSYFHEFLDDVRQASSVSRFSNSFLIFMYKYMIIWKLLFEYIAIVDKSQQDGYREWLYQQQHFIHLWRILVTFFVEHPADVEQVKKAINLFSPIESGRNAQKMNIVMFTDDVFNKISDTASVVWWLSLCVFRDFLTLFPTVTRQFWRSEKLLTSRIKSFISKHLSPSLIKDEFKLLSDHKATSKKMKITLCPNLPSNYPLNSTDVFLNVASGVPKDSFNFWIRKLAMRLQKHETNLLDSLLLWQAEVDKVLERMDVCPVCLSYTTSEGHLPSKKCYQCKHQFHGSCLQQWFQSTDRPSCPLCRELFVQKSTQQETVNFHSPVFPINFPTGSFNQLIIIICFITCTSTACWINNKKFTNQCYGLLTIQAASNKPTISGAHSDEAELCKALDNGFVPATEKERVMEGKTATCAKDKEIVTFACQIRRVLEDDGLLYQNPFCPDNVLRLARKYQVALNRQNKVSTEKTNSNSALAKDAVVGDNQKFSGRDIISSNQIDRRSISFKSALLGMSSSDIAPKASNGTTSNASNKTTVIARSPSAIKEALLRWCQIKTKDYKNINITNFSSSWANGMAFCALIHHFYPDAFDFNALDPAQRKENLALAFQVAEKYGGIVPLLEVEDMLLMGDHPDYKCIFTYVQSFYRQLRNAD
ncbi:Smoothelin-like protein [Trichinella spiralis]|uniref:Smoothelin-like protein n=1 Tax=Trichinella spiralis TaxID=6334 RepID=A0ABR3K4U9_TRISP